MKSLRELDGRLLQHWYIVALSSELKPGKILARSLYEKHYAVFRNEQGQLSALEDRCIHRGAKLSEGRCVKSGISCPYHGWNYDVNGLVVDIPSEGEKTQVSSRTWRVPSAPVVEQDGAIWLWAGEGEPTPASPPWRFPYSDDGRWVSYFMITDFNNEVDHLVQNFMDVPHTVYVHAKWFRDKASLKVPYAVETKDGKVTVIYDKPGDSIGGLLGRVFNPDGVAMRHTDQFIFPNVTRVDYRYGENGFVINSQCTPIDRYKTRVYTWIAFRGYALARLLKPVMRFYTRRVIQQDVEIMENQGSNLARHEGRAEGSVGWRSTAADDIHLAIARLRQTGIKDPAQVYDIDQRRESVFWI